MNTTAGESGRACFEAGAGSVPVYHRDGGAAPSERVAGIKEVVHGKVLEFADLGDFRDGIGGSDRERFTEIISGVLDQECAPLSAAERAQLIDMLLNDLLGFGPLEPLLADPSVSDIMVNGPDMVWVERAGKLALSDVRFSSTSHLMNVITRIASRARRRIDESSPMLDARMPDGSRVNIIIPPLSYRFPSLSIRKFVEKRFSLDDMVERGSLSADMADLLTILAKYRFNVLISGGTGVGKTTLLNAMSQHVGVHERIVTIEDTAELQLQQPNVVSLESRPPNIEGKGTISIADLLVNALRMRPDRILVGEVRGAEAAEMLQAMNTGHDGSIGTIHANSARDALLRLEGMICMNGNHEPGRVTRQQMVSALDIVVQLSRMQDGVRRVTSITELVGIEDEVILTQDLYRFLITGEAEDGMIEGSFLPAANSPAFIERIKHFRLTPGERAVIGRFVNAA
jgi:pilus assembly protein CpaF